MPLDKSVLLGFLEQIDAELNRKITLVAVGGTALTLLDAKSSTIDIDFTLPGEDYDEFQRALRIVPHGYKVDCWKDGMVFSQILPDDYLKRAVVMRKMKRILLKALSPVDVVVTKIGRLDARDKEDIENCIKRFRLTKNQVAKRANEVQYVGREENYRIHLRYVLRNSFEK